MPLQLNDIELSNGNFAPQILDIESYFVRFGTLTGEFPDSTLDANFIIKRAPTANGEVLSTVGAGNVKLTDEEIKAFPYYSELFNYLGNILYTKWLEENPQYTRKV